MKLSKTRQIADSELRSLAVALEAFVIMPNHIHSIVAIDGDRCYTPNVERAAPLPASAGYLRSPKAGSLSAIIRSYKSGVSHRCHLDGLQFAWQPGFYEKILRSDDSISAVKDYIESNSRN